MKQEHTTYAIFIAIIMMASSLVTIGATISNTLKDIRTITSEMRDSQNTSTCHELNDNWEAYYQCMYEN